MADPVAVPCDILALQPRLVSGYCGMIRKFHPVYKDVSEPVVPHIWRAEIANHRFVASDDAIVVASGKGFDRATAMRSALGEAVERYCGLRFEVGRCVLSARSMLEGESLDPAMLVLHAADQLAALGYAHYDDDLPIMWIEGRCLTTGRPLWLPAQAAYLVPPPQGGILFQTTSNGMAAGATQEDASVGALLEVIERDAFLAAWYHRLPARRIDWRTHPDPRVVGIGETYTRRGIAIELFLLPSDHAIPVVAALAVEEAPGGVAAVLGLGADPLLSAAVRSAMLEVGQVRPAIRMKLRDPALLARRAGLLADPSSVSTLEDHDLLYTDRSMLPSFAMWRDDPRDPLPVIDNEGGGDRLAGIVAQMAAIGSRCVIVDITTADIRSLGLHVCRAVIEDMQPIHFGETEFRAGGTRFYDIPRRLGLRAHAVERADLNPLPHPLS